MQNEAIDMIQGRIKRLREILKSRNLDAILIERRENYFYLSGFSGTEAHLLITSDEALLLTDFRYIEQAGKQAPHYEIIRITGSFSTVLSDLIKDKNISRIGFEGDYIPFDKLSEYRQKAENVDFVSISESLSSFRIIKDEFEIEILKRAVQIADLAFEHIIKLIKPGVIELDIAAELEYFMKKQGATGASFETIIASGERAALPHGTATLKAVQYGDVITMDYGALYNGYCSDITRTVFLGEPNEELKKIYGIVLEAQKRAEEGAVKGKPGKEIDGIARKIISDAGYGDYFGHGLGHGVGVEIHEEPRLSVRGLKAMENGMVATVEPGIYIPGLGGVRIEDIIVINDDDPIILTKASKEMIVL